MRESDGLQHATREGRGDERENIGKGLPNETPLQVAQRWRAENKKFREGMYPDVCYDYSGPLEWYQCAHYTMMIWAVTTKFGCAWARATLGYLWVDCRFSPGGNKDNRPVGPVGSDVAGLFKNYLDQHPGILAADRDAYFKVLQPGYGNTKLVRMTDQQLPKPAGSSEQRPLDVIANVRVEQAWASRQIADAIEAMTRRSQDSPLRITLKSSYAYSSDGPVMAEELLSPLDQMIAKDLTANLMARLDQALRAPSSQSAPDSAAARLGYVLDALTPLVLTGDIKEVDVDTDLQPPELAPADDLLPPMPTPIEPM
jgi:hypothetical protein